MGAGAETIMEERNSPEKTDSEGFPKFLMLTGEGREERERYMSLAEIQAFRRTNQSIGLLSNKVLLDDFFLRKITQRESGQVCSKD